MWFLLLLPLLSWAQTSSDLDAIQDLEDILPESEVRKTSYKNVEFERKFRGFRPPVRKIEMEEILASGTDRGFLKEGTILYRLSDNKPFQTNKNIYFRTYKLEDELNFRYVHNKDGTCTYRVPSKYVNSVEKELELYEPPRKFERAQNIVRTEYDRKLRMVPEAAFYLGIVQSQFIRDLFNDPKADSGISNQYALHYFTEWKLPMKVGGSLHYEKSTFNLTGGGHVFYESLSIGPQFRSKDFDLFETDWRVTGQIRVSPFARLRGETANEETNHKFNSTDLMGSFEHPWQNGWGQFVVGAYYQMQWLNIKDADRAVSVRATNKTNQSFGFFLSQVFQ